MGRTWVDFRERIPPSQPDGASSSPSLRYIATRKENYDKTKCVYSPIEPRKDGLRILATRFRGRGLSPSRYDLWMANVGPSQKLLRDFLAYKIDWGTFNRSHRKELLASGGV